MCDCALLIERRTGKTIEVAQRPHSLIYSAPTFREVLLEGFELLCLIDYAAIHAIHNQHGVKIRLHDHHRRISR